MKKLVQVQEVFKINGFDILSIGKINENGPDVWLTKKVSHILLK